jgi:hypothetical protein
VRDLYEQPADQVWERAGIALDDALEVLPTLTLDARAAAAIGHGGAFELPTEAARGLPVSAGPRSLAFRDEARRVLALGEIARDPAREDIVRGCPHVVFPWAVREGRG